MNELGGAEGYTGEKQNPPYPYAPTGYAQSQNGAPVYPAQSAPFSAQPPSAGGSLYEQQLENGQTQRPVDSDTDMSK